MSQVIVKDLITDAPGNDTDIDYCDVHYCFTIRDFILFNFCIGLLVAILCVICYSRSGRAIPKGGVVFLFILLCLGFIAIPVIVVGMLLILCLGYLPWEFRRHGCNVRAWCSNPMDRKSIPPSKFRFAKVLYVKFWDPESENNLCPTCQNVFLHRDGSVTPSINSSTTSDVKVVKYLSRTKHKPGDLDTVVTSCGHCYHYSCLKLSLDRADTCPICRRDININKCYFVRKDKNAKEEEAEENDPSDGAVVIEMEDQTSVHM